jgi:hypothetical protein
MNGEQRIRDDFEIIFSALDDCIERLDEGWPDSVEAAANRLRAELSALKTAAVGEEMLAHQIYYGTKDHVDRDDARAAARVALAMLRGDGEGPR